MKNNIFQESIISVILIVLLALFINPFNFWMPNSIHMMMILVFAIVFILFASLVWKENSKDEREGLHKMIAGRIAFLTGTILLVLGIIIQSINHEIDNWLVFTLGAMILAKIFGHIYSKINY